MQHDFGQTPNLHAERSTFDMSHGHVTTFDAGYLIPIYNAEVLPGDTINLRTNGLARLNTPLFPFYTGVHIKTYFFYVPWRILWTNFVRMMGERDNPDDSIDFMFPTVNLTSTNCTEGTLFDYFGLPIRRNIGDINSMAFRAYNRIWNEWFRDQNLQDKVFEHTDDSDSASAYRLLKRNKKHDYFTSCLPWPQKGDEVQLPFEGRARVRTGAAVGGEPNMYSDWTGLYHRLDSSNNDLRMDYMSSSYFTNNTMYVDPSDFDITIRDLREASQMQKILERDARGGTRYLERIRSMYGVTNPDARLQRPEYLGGGADYLNVNPVPQVSATTGDSPQGNLASYATFNINGGFEHSFLEHGTVIGLACVAADLGYQQGVPRSWTRKTREDLHDPLLEHIGDQPVYTRELYAGTASDDKVFGYQERFGEYRFQQSYVSGKMSSDAEQPLDAWHVYQDFSNAPTLSSDFIEENPPIDRLVAVQDQPQFTADLWHTVQHTRPLSTRGIPGLKNTL